MNRQARSAPDTSSNGVGARHVDSLASMATATVSEADHNTPAQVGRAPPAGVVREYVTVGGILDTSIVSSFDAICQQTNCTSSSPRGLAQALSSQLPYGCPYRRRIRASNGACARKSRAEPGSIQILREARDGRPGHRRADVVNLHAQWHWGGPRSSCIYNPGPPSDSTTARAEWFAQCLNKVSSLEPRPRSIAFPWKIGCEAARGDWSVYRSMIQQFAANNPDVTVAIVKRKQDVELELGAPIREATTAFSEADALAAAASDPEEQATLECINKLLFDLVVAPAATQREADRKREVMAVFQEAVRDAAAPVTEQSSNTEDTQASDVAARIIQRAIAIAEPTPAAPRRASRSKGRSSTVAATVAAYAATGCNLSRVTAEVAQAVAECAHENERRAVEIQREIDRKRRGDDAMVKQYREYLQTQIAKGDTDVAAVTAAFAFAAEGRADVFMGVGRDCSGAHSHSAGTATATTNLVQAPTDAASRRVDDMPDCDVTMGSESLTSTPLKLHGTKIVGHLGERHSIDAMVADRLAELVDDSGSSITLMGDDDLAYFQRHVPDCVHVLAANEVPPTAIRRIKGVAGVTHVTCHVRLCLDLGGVVVCCTDIPVIPGHRGLLIGNDLHRRTNASIEYTDSAVGAASVTFRARGKCGTLPATADATAPRPGLDAVVTLSDASVDTCDSAEAIAARIVRRAVDSVERETAETEEALRGVEPCAFAPSTITIPKWSRRFVRLRVPAAAIDGYDLAVLPLEDGTDLGVRVAPTLQRADKDGYVTVEIINTSQQKAVIPMLSRVARFIVDPSIAGTDLEFTVDEILEQVAVDSTLSEDDLDHVRTMLSTRRRLFATVLGWAHGFKMHIATPRIDSGEVRPPALPNKRRPPEEWAALKVVIDKLLKQKLIEPVTSPYNAQPVPVRKPDGSYRLCLDYRALNALTTKDSYPLPDVESNLAMLGNANYFTVLDLLMGFHQCEIDEESMSKTAFGTIWGQYAFRRMPMGLTSSPGTFMRLVDSALRGLPPGYAVAYADDVIIPTHGTLEEHLAQVGQVFDKLIAAGFTVRGDKVQIAKKEVPYLGFMVGAYGTRPAVEKIAAVLKLTLDSMGTDPAKAGRFAGMIGVYHRFIPYLHQTLAVFHELKEKAAPTTAIMSSLRFKAAFTVLVGDLAAVTALARPDYSKPFYVDVDTACSHGIGGALSQRLAPDETDSHKPITFRSRRLTKLERALPVREQECIGLVESLIEWRPYILHASVIVRTDHKSLQWLMRTKHREGSVMQGLAISASQFNLEIQWLPGRDHVVADFFSRPGSGESGEGGPVDKQRPELGLDMDVGEDDAADVDFTSMVTLTVEGLKTLPDEECMAFSNEDEQRPRTVATPVVEPEEEVYRRIVARAAVVFITTDSQGAINALIERHDGQAALPSVTLDRHTTASARAQLMQYMQRQYHHQPWVRSLLEASSCKLRSDRSRGGGRTQYYVAVVHDASEPATQDRLVSASFERLGDRMAAICQHADDCRFLKRVLVETFASESEEWNIPRGLKATLRGLRHSVAYRARTADEERHVDSFLTFAAAQTLPRVRDGLSGPAYGEDGDELATAMATVWRRVRRYPEMPVAIDLEGALGGRRSHIDLVQIAMDAVGDEPSLALVLDANNRMLLDDRGSDSLRALLEDGTVVKVFHYCTGDVSSLFWEYDIRSRGVYDTATADSIIRCSSKVRGLATVLRAYLGKDAVNLTLKDSFVHVPGMFGERPLPYALFVYAYEDVTLCPQLYAAQTRLLKELLELVFVLSQQKAPPMGLQHGEAAAQPASRMVVALSDGKRVVCLQERESKLYSLPSGDHRSGEGTSKKRGRELWARVMGAPPKPHANVAINARLQKEIRVGDALLMIALVPDCSRVVSGIASAVVATPTPRTHEVVLKEQFSATTPSAECEARDTALFQMLSSLTERVPDTAVIDETACGAPVDTGEAAANIVIGPTYDRESAVRRGALVLHDDTHVYLIRVVDSSTARYTLPSMQIEVNSTAEEAAIRGFEGLAGTALRKGGTDPTSEQQRRMVCPVASRAICRAFEKIEAIGVEGVTAYFSVYLPGLNDHIAALVAARMDVNGMRLTNTLARRYGSLSELPYRGVGVVRWTEFDKERALESDAKKARMKAGMMIAEKDDAMALLRIRRRADGIGDRESTDGASPQHSESTPPIVRSAEVTGTRGDSAQHSESTSEGNTLTAQSSRDERPQARAGHCPSEESPRHRTASPRVRRNRRGSQRSGTIPALGDDVLFDRLFTAATLVRYARLVGNGEVTAAVAAAQHEADLCDGERLRDAVRAAMTEGITAADNEVVSTATLTEQSDLVAQVLTQGDTEDGGRTLKAALGFLTVERIRAAQVEHPSFGDIIRTLSDPSPLLEREPIEVERNQAKDFELDSDGLLVLRGTHRIALPESLHVAAIRGLHDHMGHQGIRKVTPLVIARYWWGTTAAMSATVATYINACRICAQCKVSRHKAGSGQLVTCGEHPHDYMGADVYSTGMSSDGFDHVVSFACYFSRMITAAATRGDPSSEDIARILVEQVIRYYGTPRLIRSDHGSVFVSRLIQALYQRFGIDMKAGTPYHHRTIGLIERWHSVLKHILMCHCQETGDHDWPSFLPMLELSFNATINTATGFSPFFVVFGREAVLPTDVLRSVDGNTELPEWVQKQLIRLHVSYDAVAQKLRANALHRLKAFDLKHDVVTTFKPGDRVLLVKGKFVDGNLPKADVPTEGPFTVCRALPQDNYQLMDLHTRRLHDVVHVERLIPYPANRERPTSEAAVGSFDLDRFAVEDVVGHSVSSAADVDLGRSRGTPTIYYRIRWRGYAKDSWRSIEYLHNIMPLVRAYRVRAGLDKSMPIQGDTRIDENRPPVEQAARNKVRFRSKREPQRVALREAPSREVAKPTPAADEQRRTFEVHCVLDARRKGSGVQVLVQWKPSWVEAQALPTVLLDSALTRVQRENPTVEFAAVTSAAVFKEEHYSEVARVRLGATKGSFEALVVWSNEWIAFSALTDAVLQSEARAILEQAVAEDASTGTRAPATGIETTQNRRRSPRLSGALAVFTLGPDGTVGDARQSPRIAQVTLASPDGLVDAPPSPPPSPAHQPETARVVTAYAAQDQVIGSWSQTRIGARVLSRAYFSGTVQVLPLSDDRESRLGLRISPTICDVDPEGYVAILCINPSARAVVITQWTTIASIADSEILSVDTQRAPEPLSMEQPPISPPPSPPFASIFGAGGDFVCSAFCRSSLGHLFPSELFASPRHVGPSQATPPSHKHEWHMDGVHCPICNQDSTFSWCYCGACHCTLCSPVPRPAYGPMRPGGVYARPEPPVDPPEPAGVDRFESGTFRLSPRWKQLWSWTTQLGREFSSRIDGDGPTTSPCCHAAWGACSTCALLECTACNNIQLFPFVQRHTYGRVRRRWRVIEDQWRRVYIASGIPLTVNGVHIEDVHFCGCHREYFDLSMTSTVARAPVRPPSTGPLQLGSELDTVPNIGFVWVAAPFQPP